MTKKVRIIERKNVDGTKEYIIQQKHFLFFWMWVDAWMNGDASIRDSFTTLEEAKKNLCYFDGSKPVDTVL